MKYRKFHPRRGLVSPKGELILSLTSALDGVVVNATLLPLFPGESPVTRYTGGWVGPSAGLDGCGKSRPNRDSMPGQSSP